MTARTRSSHWTNAATRWIQLTFVENDPASWDKAFWLSLFDRTQANATCISAGGYVAYYPSQVEHQHVSRYLGDSDPFGELVAGARERKMSVMARIDPHALHQATADAYPQWVSMTEAGEPRRHWAFPDVFVSCAYGDYHDTGMRDIIAEIVREYDIDAIFANRWQGHGVCYCEGCRRRFAEASGLSLPVTGDSPGSNSWVKWRAWRRTVLSRTIVEWDDLIRSIRPHACFIPNLSSSALLDFDRELIRQHCPFLVVDHQGRTEREPLWVAGRSGKRLHAQFADRPIVQIASVGPELEPRWKDAVTSAPEIQAWILAGVAHGNCPWVTKFNAQVSDSRWVTPVVDAFRLQARLQAAYTQTLPDADIAVIDPITTAQAMGGQTLGGQSAPDTDLEGLGLYQGLIESRLPFHMVSDQDLTTDRLSEYQLLLLPNAECLSEQQCRQLVAFVDGGGSLFATSSTATRDENGRRRDRSPLATLFGVHHQGAAREALRNTYITVDAKHPVSAGFEEATRIIGGTRAISVNASDDTLVPSLMLPDFPDLPMEEVYPRDAPRDAAVLLRVHNSGARTVYLPWNVGETYARYFAPDHARLINNAICWALENPPRVEIEDAAELDVSVRSANATTLVSLFNLDNPMLMKGPLRRIAPCGPITVSVSVPSGMSEGRAELLVAETDVNSMLVEGRLKVVVDRIELLEVIRIRWQ